MFHAVHPDEVLLSSIYHISLCAFVFRAFFSLSYAIFAAGAPQCTLRVPLRCCVPPVGSYNLQGVYLKQKSRRHFYTYFVVQAEALAYKLWLLFDTSNNFPSLCIGAVLCAQDCSLLDLFHLLGLFLTKQIFLKFCRNSLNELCN